MPETGFKLGRLLETSGGEIAVQKDMAVIYGEANALGSSLFGRRNKAADFAESLSRLYREVYHKQILIIHNPGGWGHTDMSHLIKWESSIIHGVQRAVSELGRPWLLVQFIRGGPSLFNHLADFVRQIRFTYTGRLFMADAVAAQVDFLTRHVPDLEIILLGISQGAAFSNAVVRKTQDISRVYSIELGIFFPQLRWRVITPNTLAIDNNGIEPDLVVHMKWSNAAVAYAIAPFRWIRYLLTSKKQSFAACIKIPGHEYTWEQEAVGTRIQNFIKYNFRRSKYGEQR